jgi:hypothetical protein
LPPAFLFTVDLGTVSPNALGIKMPRFDRQRGSCNSMPTAEGRTWKSV